MSDRKRIDESEQLPSERVGLLAHGFAARSGDEMERGFVSRPTEQTALLQPYRVAPLIKQPGSATFLPLVVIACIGMFLYEMQLSGWHWQPFTANPFAGPGVNVLRKLGAKDPTVHEGQYHRLFMTMFLHAGVIHLLTNMLSLANVGFPLERMYGSARVAVIYLVSGVSAALSSSLFLPNTVSVGASGAIFGLLGALWSELLFNWEQPKCGLFIQLLFTTAFNFALGFLPFLDNFAHLGGFFAGFLTANAVLPSASRSVSLWQLLAAAAAFAYVGSGFYFLVNDIDPRPYCKFCHWLTCIPTPLWKCPAH